MGRFSPTFTHKTNRGQGWRIQERRKRSCGPRTHKIFVMKLDPPTAGQQLDQVIRETCVIFELDKNVVPIKPTTA